MRKIVPIMKSIVLAQRVWSPRHQGDDTATKLAATWVKKTEVSSIVNCGEGGVRKTTAIPDSFGSARRKPRSTHTNDGFAADPERECGHQVISEMTR
jgi:hypothetical protein